LAVYGEDDYRILVKHNVQLIYHVDEEGKMRPEVTPWAGMFMLKVNPLVNEDLAKRGLIYHDEDRMHSVPVCYRCETRLYHAPVPAWFIDVQKIKPDLIKQNEDINWYPDHLKHGRFGKGLETAPDWNISRSRYWGTPMPVWVGASGAKRIVGSIEELQKWAVDPSVVAKLTDIHREFLDDIDVWVDDAKTEKGKRLPEVFDCWVESGSMPYASIHYPFENKEQFEASHPAQYIAEYIAQTRAWFYTLHVMSVGLFGKGTFENAVTTGTILAEDGAKMSKSKKNYPDPSLLIEKYGVDALRFYLMSSVVMKAENLNFSEKQVAEIQQKIVQILWNTFAFYKLYANLDKVPESVQPNHVLDRWLVSMTQTLVKDVTTAMDSYDTVTSCRLIGEYINELSTWYLRRSRERLKEDQLSKQTFAWALLRLLQVLAPIMPFVTELIYQNLVGSGESVHLTTWPTADEKQIDAVLEEDMSYAKQVVEKIHAQRKEHEMPIRQPLANVTIASAHALLTGGIVDVIKEEVNIKAIEFSKGENDIVAKLDTTLTPELLAEGKMRDLIRKVQALRKEKGLAVDAMVAMQFPEEYKEMPKALLEDVQRKTLVESVVWGNSLEILIG
jgi:isoleucyl-tRNA synthetase